MSCKKKNSKPFFRNIFYNYIFDFLEMLRNIIKNLHKKARKPYFFATRYLWGVHFLGKCYTVANFFFEKEHKNIARKK